MQRISTFIRFYFTKAARLIMILPYTKSQFPYSFVILVPPEAPNISAITINSTSLYINWTMFLNSTNVYKQLQGYHVYYWRESEEDEISNLTQFHSDIHLDNLEKWTIYCFNITAFTYGGNGPTGELCARTSEDGMLKYCTPYRTIPYHTIPYHTIPYHTIPYHTIPYHTIPYHTIPYHTIPYHTIPYHTIP